MQSNVFISAKAVLNKARFYIFIPSSLPFLERRVIEDVYILTETTTEFTSSVHISVLSLLNPLFGEYRNGPVRALLYKVRCAIRICVHSG